MKVQVYIDEFPQVDDKGMQHFSAKKRVGRGQHLIVPAVIDIPDGDIPHLEYTNEKGGWINSELIQPHQETPVKWSDWWLEK